MTTHVYTSADMDHRRTELLDLRKKGQMSLRTSSELDAIQHYGLDGWEDYCSKRHVADLLPSKRWAA